MPRYQGQNLATFDPTANYSAGNKRHNLGKKVLNIGGTKLLENGFCFRMLPTYDTDSSGSYVLDAQGRPQLAPFFINNDPAQGYGDWWRIYEVVSFFGHPSVSFIVTADTENGDKFNSPAWMLYKAGLDATKNQVGGEIGRIFAMLRDYKEGFGKNSLVGSLKVPTKVLFVSGSQIYVRQDGSIGLSAFEQEGKDARIFGFSKTGMEAFQNALKVQNEQGILCGDMLSLDAAKLVTVVQTGFGRASRLPRPQAVSIDGPDYVYVPTYAAPANPSEIVLLGKPNPKEGQAEGGKSHTVILHNNFMGQTVSLRPYEQQLRENNCSFDDMMYVPSFGEQAQLMADAFPRQVLDYAWRERSDYLAVLPTGATTVQMPSNMPPQQQPWQAPPAAQPWQAPAPQPTWQQHAVPPMGQPLPPGHPMHTQMTQAGTPPWVEQSHGDGFNPPPVQVADVAPSNDLVIAPIGAPAMPAGVVPPPAAPTAHADALTRARAAANRS